MMTKRIIIFLAMFLLLTSYIFSCERVKDDVALAQKIEKDIEDSARQGRVFSFDIYSDFAWTDLYVVDPYTSIEYIDEFDLWEIDRNILSGLIYTDHNQGLVFKNGKKIVKCALISPSRIYVEKDCIFSKKEAVFSVEKRDDGYIYLKNKKYSPSRGKKNKIKN